MSNINLNEVRDTISKIIDTDLGKSLGELGAIKDIRLDGNKIAIDLELVQPIQWAAAEINDSCADALGKAFPGCESEINISEIFVDSYNRELLPGVKNIIAVASGKGGVGKSSVASNIAAALSLGGAKVGILDGDVYGPSQPTMFGLEGEAFRGAVTPDGKQVAIPHEKYGIKVASMGFMLNRDEAAIIRGPLLAGYFSMLFEQIEWGPLDYLVFDLPPGTGDVQLTLTQRIPLTGAVVVTTPQEIAVADVRRAISMFKRVNVDILGIVENMSYFIPPDMPDKKYYIFGQGGGKAVAEENGIHFLGEIPLDIKMREGNDGGMPVVLDHESQAQAAIITEIVMDMVSRIRQLNYAKSQEGDLKIEL
jgi:ATP-binding protein involved in chromosome partitioning